ncbi:MAG: ChaN family lipoprotein [Deltaproteobacteria bacterium]|nr:ChaN family lipoprotein [Deltaproteobacteria bacterium]
MIFVRGRFMILSAYFMLAMAGCAGTHATYRGGIDVPYPPKEPPRADDIRHLPTGLALSFDGAMDMISAARLICIGETHDNMNAHRVELAIIRELDRRFPGKVAVGMEMFREPDQDALDRWTKGEMTEIEFLKATKWYENWGSDFGYYREILQFARERRIDVIALNPSRELQQEVRKAGLDNIPETLKAKLPVVGEPDPYQRAAMKGVYGGHLATEGKFDAFFRVQLLWEETMAVRVVDYLRSRRGEGKKMVTLTGGWHVRYGFGIPKKVLRRMPLSYTIVMPEEISIPEDKKDRLMKVELPEIPLLPADFHWMVAYEDLEGKSMALGVVLSAKDNDVLVEGVREGSPAAKAGILKGDRLVYIDGEPVSDMSDVYLRVRAKKEGDRAAVAVLRGGIRMQLDVLFFPLPGKKPHE